MLCPKCFNDKTSCADSRKDTDMIKRLRKCNNCNYHWITIEIDEDLYKSILESKQNNVHTKDIR